MTSNVLITITSRHKNQKDSDSIQAVSSGTYRYVRDKHVICYDEILEETFEGEPITSSCIMKITEDSLSLIRHGQIETEMHFKPDETYNGYYDTLAGSMQMCLRTSFFHITETEDTVSVRLEYSLDLNYSHVSDCCLNIDITSQKKKKKDE